MGRAPENQAPNKESHPIHSIQEVSGSVLSEAETPLLFSLDRPLELLADDLLKYFEGQTLPMKLIFEQHHIGRRYVERNYKAALNRLESERKIVANPPAAKRPRRNDEKTFGPSVEVSFPRRKKI